MPVREQEWQQVKASPYGLGIPIPFLLPPEGRAALEDSFSLASTPEAGQSPPGTWEEMGGKGRGFPPALLLRAGVSQGQSAPKSESQQTVAIPTPNAKLTNKTGETKKWGGGKTNQNRTPCPPAQGGGSRVQPVAGAGDQGRGSSWAGTAPGPRSCPHRQRPRHPRCSGL